RSSISAISIPFCKNVSTPRVLALSIAAVSLTQLNSSTERDMAKLKITDLQQMKRDGTKIQAAICYEHQMAQIYDRAGVDLITVGDTVGAALWGQATWFEVTMDQMVLTC